MSANYSNDQQTLEQLNNRQDDQSYTYKLKSYKNNSHMKYVRVISCKTWIALKNTLSVPLKLS